MDKSRNKLAKDTTLHIKASQDTVNTFDYLMHSEGLTKKDLLAKMVELYLSVKEDRYLSTKPIMARMNQIITTVSTQSQLTEMLIDQQNKLYAALFGDDESEE